MTTVGLGLLGASVVVLLYEGDAPKVLEGFGFGAALLAMFMRVGGGIFTKAADVGADLVGKVEAGIPEDDPRNAATIADNVGDNVGDCAGMAADLFESYAVTLVAALILGSVAFGEYGLVFPLIIPAIGAVTALLGVYITKARPGENALSAINRGFYIAAVVSAVLSGIAAYTYLPVDLRASSGSTERGGQRARPATRASPRSSRSSSASCSPASSCGSPATSPAPTSARPWTSPAPRSPARPPSCSRASASAWSRRSTPRRSSPVPSTSPSCWVPAPRPWRCSSSSLAGCGLLTTVGVIVAMDTFGPVSDNAQGIAEMSGDVDEEGAQILTELDAVGNTTKAITKGIAIATAVLAATALFGSYSDAWQSTAPGDHRPRRDQGAAGHASSSRTFDLQVVTPSVLVGVLIGAAVVFLFSGLAINAVTRAAGAIVFEVRRQFREHPGIMDYTEKPEYGRVVDICTRDSLRELATPGLLAALMPVAVGFGLGIGPLAGFLAGAIGAGALMAVFLANSGGSWDNAKKIVEDGAHGGKGSEAHEATIIGDTVGDPFKDTAGPAINPLLKVMNLVSVLIAPAIVSLTVGSERLGPDALRHRGRRLRHRPGLGGVLQEQGHRDRHRQRPRRGSGGAASTRCPSSRSRGCRGAGFRWDPAPRASPVEVPRRADGRARASAGRGTSTQPGGAQRRPLLLKDRQQLGSDGHGDGRGVLAGQVGQADRGADPGHGRPAACPSASRTAAEPARTWPSDPIRPIVPRCPQRRAASHSAASSAWSWVITSTWVPPADLAEHQLRAAPRGARAPGATASSSTASRARVELLLARVDQVQLEVVAGQDPGQLEPDVPDAEDGHRTAPRQRLEQHVDLAAAALPPVLGARLVAERRR